MKTDRQEAIIRLIAENDIETQDELVSRLRQMGHAVTQATVSRDIKKLRLTKVQTSGGSFRYAPESRGEAEDRQDKLRMLRNSFVSVTEADILLVVKTAPGMAMAAGAALDDWEYDGKIGCIAGDDTVFCAFSSREKALDAKHRLTRLLGL